MRGRPRGERESGGERGRGEIGLLIIGLLKLNARLAYNSW